MIQGPQNVRGAADGETGTERVLLLQFFDDVALVGVVLALNAVPQSADIQVGWSRGSNHLEERADA